MSGIADRNRERFTAVYARPCCEVFARVEEEGRTRIVGYAATYTGLSEDLGGFRTRVSPHAFDGVVITSDVRFLVNHNPDLLLGRTRSGTLSLASDERGLKFEAEPPDTEMARHYVEAIRRGDMDGCSFTCTVKEDRWDVADDLAVRTILEVSDLFDVGPVSFPAFLDTSVSSTVQASLDRARAAFAAGRRPGGMSAETLRLRLELARRRFPGPEQTHAHRR
jgi:HK97 family phage prohead protease